MVVTYGMAGAVVGVFVGLGAFGSRIAVPALLMVAGAAIGAAVAIAAGARPTRSAPPKPAVVRGAAVALRRTPAREFRLKSRSSANGEAPAAAAAAPASRPRVASAPVPRVDVNAAGVEELTRLRGVGAAAATRIVAHRDQHGPFGAVADLERVERFDAGRVARLSELAVVGPEPAAPPTNGAASVVVAKACPVCGDPVPSGRATYCSTACKNSAYRQRRRKRQSERETASV